MMGHEASDIRLTPGSVWQGYDGRKINGSSASSRPVRCSSSCQTACPKESNGSQVHAWLVAAVSIGTYCEAGRGVKSPSRCIHSSIRSGHRVTGSLVGRKPYPCPPLS